MRKLNLDLMMADDRLHQIFEVTDGQLPHKIIDALIRLTAHYTDRFGSDMVWDLLSVNKELEGRPDEILRYFGFRESGVDHRAFIESRYDNLGSGFGGIELNPYRAIYKLQGILDEKGNYHWLFYSLGTYAGSETLEEVE